MLNKDYQRTHEMQYVNRMTGISLVGEGVLEFWQGWSGYIHHRAQAQPSDVALGVDMYADYNQVTQSSAKK